MSLVNFLVLTVKAVIEITVLQAVSLQLGIEAIIVAHLQIRNIQKALDNRVSFVLEADGKTPVLYLNLDVPILIEFYKTPISKLHITPPYH